MPKSLRKNPGWKLEQATIDIVAAARTKLSLTNAEVIDLWANAWQNQQAAEREAQTNPVTIEGVAVDSQPLRYESAGIPGPQDRPTAERIETPYQIERRLKLEALRAQLANGTQAPGVEEVVGATVEAITLPFAVLINGQKHEVVEFKGRRVLECIWPNSRVMMKNLTPQETAIYWKDRVRA